MKKNLLFFLSFFFSIGFFSQVGQWKKYTTGNSNTPTNSWTAICNDKTNKLFFAKSGYPINTIIVTDSFIPYSPPYNYTYKSCVCDTTNRAYFAAQNYGIFLNNGVGWIAYNAVNSLPEIQFPLKVITDSMNLVWIVSSDASSNTYGIMRITGANQRYYSFANGLLPFDKVNAFFVKDSNDIWIGGKNANNIAHWNGSAWTIANTGFSFSNVSDIVKDASGNVWFSTNGNGLIKYDGTSWTNYTTGNSTIASDGLSHIRIDQNNVVWIYALNIGIIYYDGISFNVFTPGNSPLPSHTINNLNVDAYNNKWFPTLSGTAVYNETGVVGIKDSEMQTEVFSVFPNPSGGNLNVSGNFSSTIKLKVTDLSARVVIEKTINAEGNTNSIQLSVPELSSGLYFLNIYSEGKMQTLKFIKE